MCAEGIGYRRRWVIWALLGTGTTSLATRSVLKALTDEYLGQYFIPKRATTGMTWPRSFVRVGWVNMDSMGKPKKQWVIFNMDLPTGKRETVGELLRTGRAEALSRTSERASAPSPMRRRLGWGA